MLRCSKEDYVTASTFSGDPDDLDAQKVGTALKFPTMSRPNDDQGRCRVNRIWELIANFDE